MEGAGLVVTYTAASQQGGDQNVLASFEGLLLCPPFLQSLVETRRPSIYTVYGYTSQRNLEKGCIVGSKCLRNSPLTLDGLTVGQPEALPGLARMRLKVCGGGHWGCE